MKRLTWIFLLATMPVCQTYCEDPSRGANRVYVRIYSHEKDLKPPVLRPLTLQIPVNMKCEQKADGKVELSLFVDTEGRARNIMFIRPLGTEVDRFALQLAEDDRFVPASYDGKPVVAGANLEIGVHSCFVKARDTTGKETYTLQLRSIPSQKLRLNEAVPEKSVLTSGPFTYDESTFESMKANQLAAFKNGLAREGLKPPVPLLQPYADFTIEARKSHVSGLCLVELIVDPQGMPQNLKLIKSVDPGLGRNALIAVSKYRFKPATKDGEPVAMYVNAEVNFKFY